MYGKGRTSRPSIVGEPWLRRRHPKRRERPTARFGESRLTRCRVQDAPLTSQSNRPPQLAAKASDGQPEPLALGCHDEGMVEAVIFHAIDVDLDARIRAASGDVGPEQSLFCSEKQGDQSGERNESGDD